MTVLANKGKPARQGQRNASEIGEIEKEMDDDHAENADTAQSVQLPNALLFLRHFAFASSSSSKTR